MGTFRVEVEIENPARPGERRALRSVLVDTGAELSWVPAELLESLGVERNNLWRFRQADGTVLDRWTGIVVVSGAGKRTGDDVVFPETSRCSAPAHSRGSTFASSPSRSGWWTPGPRRPR
jgi:hypothetical protein